MRRYSRGMPSGVRVPPTAPPFAFDVLDCQRVGAGRASARWRLEGHTAEGRRLLLDFDAGAGAGTAAASAGSADARAAEMPSLPSRLTGAIVAATDTDTSVVTAAAAATDVAAAVDASAGEMRRGWTVLAEQGRFDLGPVQLFVHEDVSATAARAVPPRAVPLGKRLFWRAVFALLATRAGRRWLERRAAA